MVRAGASRRGRGRISTVRGRALYTALYTVKRPLYKLYFGLSLSRLACGVYSVYSYTVYTQYSVYSIQRYTPSLCSRIDEQPGGDDGRRRQTL